MLIESKKYICYLFFIFIFFIIYFCISLNVLSNEYTNSHNLWLYCLIYTIVFPLKIYLFKEYIIDKKEDNFLLKKKIIDFKVNYNLSLSNLTYFIFIYLLEVILFIWGCVEIVNEPYQKYSNIYILSLFNIIISGIISLFFSLMLIRIVNKSMKNKSENDELKIEEELIEEQHIEENNKIEIAEMNIYGTNYKIIEI